MILVGVDPGHHGAIAVYDASSRRVCAVHDMPIYRKVVARGERTRIDPLRLFRIIDEIGATGADCVIIEDVQGRGLQKGASEMGYGVGLIHMACTIAKLTVEMVQPATWKRKLRVPADKKGATERAELLFPQQRELFRGSRGGFLDGRAEAAMIALYGAEKRA